MFHSKKYKEFAENVKILQELDLRINSYYDDMLFLLKEKEKLIEKKEIELKKELNREENALKKIYEEKSKGFPWLANAIAEYYKYIDIEIAEYLEKKTHPAYSSAEIVRNIANEKSILQKQLRIAKNIVAYYESLFPWIVEYVGDNLDDLLESIDNKNNITNENDPALKYLTKVEYDSLSEEVRNQKALDRYMSSKSTPWKIGRDYERYIGYIYEQQGFKVKYVGIEDGLEDLGRDLICSKDDKIEIVQCKCWASHKLIREKHINQLYGTTVKYYIDNIETFQSIDSLNVLSKSLMNEKISAVLITSTKLSDTAKKFSEVLGIKFLEDMPLKKYPIIKCNINNGEKIYHLPFDQQYDKTSVSNSGEFYAMTVKDAIEKGFRRAQRWSGNSKKS